MRLAAIYFPLLADEVAPCYESIANEAILKSVKDREKREASAPHQGLSKEIARFREYTAAILISLIASLSLEDFSGSKHATRLDLSSAYDLEEGCRLADGPFSSTVKYNEAVQLLATIHAAQYFADINRGSQPEVVGWRRGIHCVIPNLLLDMKPTAKSITLACRDIFYANIRVHEDGYIKSATLGSFIPDAIHLEDQTVLGADLAVMDISQHPRLGQAQTTPPNTLLYLGLERPLNYNEPDICFVGRVDGTVIGTVSVLDVLQGIARSLSQPQECHHGEISVGVINVKTSTWINKKRNIPVGSVEAPVLLAVKDDPSWALFAMGQSSYYQSCIVLRCVSCALHTAAKNNWNGESVVLIGYS